MPTYSYKCKECGKVFDAFHSMSCTDAQHCPECQGVGQKLMSASSVIFKGSGFYSTEKPGESKASDQTKDSGKTEAKPAASEGKTEKPAAKADPTVAAAA
jgi:putative FmdB family regulatory protein